MSRETETGFHV